MATIVNTPGNTESNSGVGMVMGVLLAIVIIALFFVYALPAMRGANRGTTVNVPDKLDVNVNQQPSN